MAAVAAGAAALLEEATQATADRRPAIVAGDFAAFIVTTIDGPFTESKEVVGGYAVFEFNSREEAIESAVSFMELHRQHWPEWVGETEVRQIFGPDDFGPQCRGMNANG